MRETGRSRRLTAAIGATVLAIMVFGFTGRSFADGYEDQCVLSASRLLPAHAQVSATNTSPAPTNVVFQHGRDVALRWIQVEFTMAVGNRKIVRGFLCARNPDGDFYAFPPDNDPLQSTFDWYRAHNIH
jgi:hypothetical protein